MREKSELEKYYEEKVRPQLADKFGIKNNMAIPTIRKIVVNAGIGSEYKTNSNVVNEMVEVIAQITGQRPVVTKARESIANFKLREGMPNGVKVTLRNDKMWEFYYKLVNITLARVKDFRGVSRTSFDKRGNYTLGIKEHTVFPEIDTTKLTKIRSLQVVIETSAPNDEQAEMLLELLGMPFRKDKKKVDIK